MSKVSGIAKTALATCLASAGTVGAYVLPKLPLRPEVLGVAGLTALYAYFSVKLYHQAYKDLIK